MDSRFEIPGTNIRFGLDPILSFFPAAGDLITLAISGMLVYQMQQHGASRKVVIKMMINVLIDVVVGAIPLIGVIFDTIYKANNRNVRLLKEHYQEGKHMGKGTGLIIAFMLVALLILGAILYGMWLILDAIF